MLGAFIEIKFFYFNELIRTKVLIIEINIKFCSDIRTFPDCESHLSILNNINDKMLMNKK